MNLRILKHAKIIANRTERGFMRLATTGPGIIAAGSITGGIGGAILGGANGALTDVLTDANNTKGTKGIRKRICGLTIGTAIGGTAGFFAGSGIGMFGACANAFPVATSLTLVAVGSNVARRSNASSI